MNVEDPHPTELRTLARVAVRCLRRVLRQRAPTLAASFEAWLRSLSGDAPVERYFTHPQAFPMLLLPWWLEETLAGRPSRRFQRDLVQATVAGYAFARLVDDLMDRERAPDPRALPALLVLHGEFEQRYHRHFPAGHPFWASFRAASYEAAEAAAREMASEVIDATGFRDASARKVAGAGIAIAAVCHRHRRPELIGAWRDFVELFGRWHQMLDDTRDWARDLARGGTTYFLSEARRRSPASPMAWALDEGLGWGRTELDAAMADLLVAADGLGSERVRAYLWARQRALEEEWPVRLADAARLRRLASIAGSG